MAIHEVTTRLLFEVCRPFKRGYSAAEGDQFYMYSAFSFENYDRTLTERIKSICPDFVAGKLKKLIFDIKTFYVVEGFICKRQAND